MQTIQRDPGAFVATPHPLGSGILSDMGSALAIGEREHFKKLAAEV